MNPFRPPPVLRVRVPPKLGEHRTHPQQAHPPETVAAVRRLVETTLLPHKVIGERTGVDKGTVSRWAHKHGWRRPPGAPAAPQRQTPAYVPVLVGRALAQRLRIQAERLISDIESAPRVDLAALKEALALLERARAEQQIRRSRRLRPPTPDEIDERRAADEAARTDAAEARRHDRQALLDLEQPAPAAPNQPAPYVWTWNRSESAKMGWRGRYRRMREAGVTFKKDR